MAKRSRRPSVLRWWQAVLDETKMVVDSGLDRLRAGEDDEDTRNDLAELFDALAEVNAKLDALEQEAPKGTDPAS